MEIRTLTDGERTRVATLLDDWRLAEGWSAGDRFRRQARWDPGWQDENVLVALDHGRPVGTLSIVPRRLRILGHDVPTGGIGSLYVARALRSRGVASALLERACEAMAASGLEIAVAFPGAPPATLDFFTRRGWFGWGGQQTILRAEPNGSRSAESDSGEIEVAPVEPGDDRALHAVQSIHAAYAASRSGIVVRDAAYWRVFQELASAPREEFLVARRGGLTVAYARASILDDVLTISEIGRFEDGAAALAELIASLLVPREGDPLAPGGRGSLASSVQLRAFCVLPTFDDLGLTVALEQRGIRSHPMEEAPAGLRCLDLSAFAARLDVDLLPGEEGVGFLRRILPPDAMVFWPSDRF